MIDVHCHLTYPGLDEIREKVVENCRKKMDAIITCGFPRDCNKALGLVHKYKKFVYLTLGLHPHDIVEMSDKDMEEYIETVKTNEKNIVGIGEIGLDNHWFPDNKHKDRLKKFFIRCLDLSIELDLPVVLHTRKAEQECFDIVVDKGIEKAVFHSYTGNLTLAQKIVERGYYISVSTMISKSKNTKKIGSKFPLEKLLTETDAPFLSPYDNQKNTPLNVEHTLSVMSHLRNMSVKDIDKQIMKNAKEIFRI